MKLWIFLLIVLVIYLNWPRIQAWLAMKFIQRVQRKVMDAAQAEARARQREAGSRAYDPEPGSGEAQRNQKQQLEEIEARKFERPSQDDYVDFEELPK